MVEPSGQGVGRSRFWGMCEQIFPTSENPKVWSSLLPYSRGSLVTHRMTSVQRCTPYNELVTGSRTKNRNPDTLHCRPPLGGHSTFPATVCVSRIIFPVHYPEANLLYWVQFFLLTSRWQSAQINWTSWRTLFTTENPRNTSPLSLLWMYPQIHSLLMSILIPICNPSVNPRPVSVTFLEESLYLPQSGWLLRHAWPENQSWKGKTQAQGEVGQEDSQRENNAACNCWFGKHKRGPWAISWHPHGSQDLHTTTFKDPISLNILIKQNNNNKKTTKQNILPEPLERNSALSDSTQIKFLLIRNMR